MTSVNEVRAIDWSQTSASVRTLARGRLEFTDHTAFLTSWRKPSVPVRLLRMACENWVAALAAAPIVLMYPLFLVIFGRSATTIVMIGFTAGLAPVILKTVEGLTGTRPVLLAVGRSFRVTPAQQFAKILLPAALPSIFVGMRLGLVFAMINIVGVEFLINFGGLGQLINELAERYDLPGTYGAILFVILVSIVFFDLTERLERWLRPGK